MFTRTVVELAKLFELMIFFGPALVVLLRFYWAKKKPGSDTIALVLIYTSVVLGIQWSDQFEMYKSLKETCTLLQDKLVDISGDEDAANTSGDFPYECQLALGYAESPSPDDY